MDHADRSAAAPMLMERADGSLNGGGTTRSMETAATIEQFENIFGPSARDIKLDNQRHKRHQRWHLPDVLKGPNNYLTDRVDGLISDATNSPFTRNILPYVYMEQPDQKITWNVYSFDEGMASRVPYESAARVLPQTKRSYKGYIVRSGLAIQMEHNFMASEAGRLNFKRQLQQLVGSVQLTNDYDVHIALLTAPSYQREMDEKYMETDNNFAQCCRQYADMFGMVNKTPNALDILIEDAKKHVKLWGGQAPTFMLCNGALTASLTMLPEKTNYLTNGPDGAKRLAQGPELPSYRGLSIINTRQFAVESGARPRDMLRRRVRVGQYYLITDPAYDATDVADKAQARNQTSYEFYDQSKDSFFRMTYDELRRKALKQSAARDDPNYRGGGDEMELDDGPDGPYRAESDPYDNYQARLSQDHQCARLAVLMDLLATGRDAQNRLATSQQLNATFGNMRQRWTSVNTAVNLTRLPGILRSSASNALLELYSENNRNHVTGVTPAFEACETAFQQAQTQQDPLAKYTDAWIAELFSEAADVAARVSLQDPDPNGDMTENLLQNRDNAFQLENLGVSFATQSKSSVLSQILFNHVAVELLDNFPYVKYNPTTQRYTVTHKDLSPGRSTLSPSECALRLVSANPVSDLNDLVPGVKTYDSSNIFSEQNFNHKLAEYFKANPEQASVYQAYGAVFDSSKVKVISSQIDAIMGTTHQNLNLNNNAQGLEIARNCYVAMHVPHIATVKCCVTFGYTGQANISPLDIPDMQVNDLYQNSPAVAFNAVNNQAFANGAMIPWPLIAVMLHAHEKLVTTINSCSGQQNPNPVNIALLTGALETMRRFWENIQVVNIDAYNTYVHGNPRADDNVDRPKMYMHEVPQANNFDQQIYNCRSQNSSTGAANSFMHSHAMLRLVASLYMRSCVAADTQIERLVRVFLKIENNNAAQLDRAGCEGRQPYSMQRRIPHNAANNAIVNADMPDNTQERRNVLGLSNDDSRSDAFFARIGVCCSRAAGPMFATAVMDKLDYYLSFPGGSGGGGGGGGGGGNGGNNGGGRGAFREGPVDLLLVRPNIEHNMLGAIVARGGTQELGATFWGQTEMSCYDDAQHGIWGMSYKYHAKALVTNNKNMMRLFDIAFDGYSGGMDATFVDASRESIDAFRDASFNRSEAYSGDSFLVFELPRDNAESKAPRLPNPITWNWAGRIEDTKAKAAPDRGDVVCRDRYKHNLMYATNQPNSGLLDSTARAALANSLQLLGMDNLQHHITTTSGPPGYNTIQNMTDLNNIFYHGYLAVYDGQGNRKSLTKGSGHLGPCWEGVASVREGRGLPQPTGVPTLQHLV